MRLGIVLAAFSANPGCDWRMYPDQCSGHGDLEEWCDQDRVMMCIHEHMGNHADVMKRCMPGGCYKDPATGDFACKMPGYTCPAGVTGYQCVEGHRVECTTGGVARDFGDCTWSAGPGAPDLRCVENPGGEMLNCGYTSERCTTPGEVRCLGSGTVACMAAVWQAYVPSTATQQAVCDASKIRYVSCTQGNHAGDDTWCEGDEIVRCDDCVSYQDAKTFESLCIKVTSLAKCQPGTCVSHSIEYGVPETITGCTEPGPECTASGQHICRGNRPGYCSAPGVVALARPCPEIWAATQTCQLDAAGNALCK